MRRPCPYWLAAWWGRSIPTLPYTYRTSPEQSKPARGEAPPQL